MCLSVCDFVSVREREGLRLSVCMREREEREREQGKRACSKYNCTLFLKSFVVRVYLYASVPHCDQKRWIEVVCVYGCACLRVSMCSAD